MWLSEVIIKKSANLAATSPINGRLLLSRLPPQHVTVTERDVATEYALELLEEGDILLVAGKGGEHYQEIGNR